MCHFFSISKSALQRIVALVCGMLVLFLLVGAVSVQAQSDLLESGATTTASTTSTEIVDIGSEATQSLYDPILYYFYSPTCPHCRDQAAFLDSLELDYPMLEVRRYDVATTKEHHALMRELAAEYEYERYLGGVPLTFVGPAAFSGFDSDETTGRDIEYAVRETLGMHEGASTDATLREGGARPSTSTFDVPFLGTLDPSEYSFAVLAILLGFLDGFNVCSLGALVLIIGLTLKLQRRRAIVLFGGTYILTTALIYGALIVLWYKIFQAFTDYMTTLTLGIALISIGAGLYFLKEYLRMLSRGAVCELSESTLIQRMTERTGRAFEDATKLVTVLGTVLAFAAVITIVEFPCSAGVPVVFAAMLADAGMSTLGYLGHIGLFVLFYMLDELVIFGIAAYKLRIWMTSGTFTKWAVLGEALILLGIGTYYLGTIVGWF